MIGNCINGICKFVYDQLWLFEYAKSIGEINHKYGFSGVGKKSRLNKYMEKEFVGQLV